MVNFKLINHNIDQVGAEASKIEAKINFRDHVANHFMNQAHKIDKRLVKANKENKPTHDIFDADHLLRQQIGTMSEEEEAKVLKDTTDQAEQRKR